MPRFIKYLSEPCSLEFFFSKRRTSSLFPRVNPITTPKRRRVFFLSLLMLPYAFWLISCRHLSADRIVIFIGNQCSNSTWYCVFRNAGKSSLFFPWLKKKMIGGLSICSAQMDHAMYNREILTGEPNLFSLSFFNELLFPFCCVCVCVCRNDEKKRRISWGSSAKRKRLPVPGRMRPSGKRRMPSGR